LVPAKRVSWRSRAACIRERMTAELSPGLSFCSSRMESAGASMWMSMRSSSGPLILARHLVICDGEHRHSCFGSPKYPQGQRFVAFLPPDHLLPAPSAIGNQARRTKHEERRPAPHDHRRPHQEAPARFGPVPTGSSGPNRGGRSLCMELGERRDETRKPIPA